MGAWDASAQTEILKFPAGFRWCVATAAHQVEGYNVDSDWWAFEQQPGSIKTGEVSGPACDHWNRVVEDSLLMKSIGVGQYRFSVEWAKIEPKEGEWNEDALAHYAGEVSTLRLLGIEPMVTLHHFTFPQWVQVKGGWTWDGLPEAFERFTRKVYGVLGQDVVDWVTLNEPMVTLLGGYVSGEVPPQKKDMKAAGIAITGMLKAHAASYRALHAAAAAAGRPVRVGVAHHLRVFDAFRPFNPADVLAAHLFDNAFNWAFFDAIETGRLKLWVPTAIHLNQVIPGLAGTQDFLGVNYYSRDMVKVSFTAGNPLPAERVSNPANVHNDLDWEIYPWGFYRTLKAVHEHSPRKPIIITENGTADHADAFRSRFLVDHLKAVHQAIQEGIRVEGYCHWSLMDNFEWNEGFTPKFGLFETDYATQARIPRASALLFSKIAHANAVERDDSVPWGTWRRPGRQR
ncbi:MAG TPA: glycoside hydrolase family 1 protein [Bdellovibrionota bacterium]|nr:glycoside hydrolase family 1 protein [Bdellovibrionota bacterium]